VYLPKKKEEEEEEKEKCGTRISPHYLSASLGQLFSFVPLFRLHP
jgi:hypothetical protein